MTEQRQRSEMYYLDLARSGNYIFYADNTVAELGTKAVERTFEAPTRVPGKFRRHQFEQRVPHQQQLIGGFDDLARNRQRDQIVESGDKTGESAFEFIPDEVVAKMRLWQDSLPQIDAESIAQAAEEMIATGDELETEKVHCVDCDDDEYACYTSGWSKHYWKYPMIDIGSDEASNLVPLDLARAITLNPQMLEIHDEYELFEKDYLATSRIAQVDLNKLPAAYIGGSDKGSLAINPSDQYAGGLVSVSLGYWCEDEAAESASWRFRNRSSDQLTESTGSIVAALQAKLTQGGERVEVADYETLWSEVRRVMGEKGLALTWQYRYQGMGESGANVYAVNEVTLQNSKPLSSGSGEGRMMIDDAYSQLVENRQPTYGRPTWK